MPSASETSPGSSEGRGSSAPRRSRPGKQASHRAATPPKAYVTDYRFGKPTEKDRTAAEYKLPDDDTDKDGVGVVEAVVANETMTRLEQVRYHYRLTQEEFARLIGVERSTYAEYVAGNSPPPPTLLVVAVAAFPKVKKLWPTSAEVGVWVTRAKRVTGGAPGRPDMPPLPTMPRSRHMLVVEPDGGAAGTVPPGPILEVLADDIVMLDEETWQRIVAIATDNLAAALQLLTEAVPDYDTASGCEVKVEVTDASRLTDPHLFMRGFVCPDKSWVDISLDRGWLDAVDRTGVVAPDGVFLVRFLDQGSGQPQRVLGMRCLPAFVDGDRFADWEPMPSPASLTSDEDGQVHVVWDEPDVAAAAKAYTRYLETGSWDDHDK